MSEKLVLAFFYIYRGKGNFGVFVYGLPVSLFMMTL